LRNPTHTVPDFLDIASGQLGNQTCNNYVNASNEWANRPKVDVSRLLAIFASIRISSKDYIDDALDRDRYLTKRFVDDLEKLDDKLLLLFFDSVDCSPKAIQTWILVQAQESSCLSSSACSHNREILGNEVCAPPWNVMIST